MDDACICLCVIYLQHFFSTRSESIKKIAVKSSLQTSHLPWIIDGENTQASKAKETVQIWQWTWRSYTRMCLSELYAVRFIHGSKCILWRQSSAWEETEKQMGKQKKSSIIILTHHTWFLNNIDWNRVDMHKCGSVCWEEKVERNTECERERENCLIASHLFSLSSWLTCDSNFAEKRQTVLLCSPHLFHSHCPTGVS